MKNPSWLLYTSLPVLAAALILLGASALFSGCYTLKQGVAMLGYLNRAVPLESLLAAAPDDAAPGDPAPGDSASGDPAGEARRFAQRVGDIRAFAMEELGLRETANYTRYVDINRDYLAAVVSASAKDAFIRHEWWFPVVGKVPYKGFFDPRDARREREKLEKRDLDVWVRGVDAFSTLGWFRDPLYSYMRDYPVFRLADLLIHETLHATVYLKNHSQFNEELAEFVGTEGARLYVEKTFGPGSTEYREMMDSEADNQTFLARIRELIAELEILYARDLDREEKLRQKDEVIRAAQARFEADYDTLFQSDNYRGFSRLPVNNAYLELFRLYYAEDRFFRDLYHRSGRDLPRFIAAAKTLTAKSGDPRLQLQRALEESGK
jgi:predicted aminopeptidase